MFSKKTISRKFPLLALIAILTGCSTLHEEKTETAIRCALPPITGCYYTSCGGGPAIDEIPFKFYTHIFYAFVKADGNGNIIDPEKHLIILKELKYHAQKTNTFILISIGGGSFKTFPVIMKNETNADKFIASLIKMLDESHCDGIDIDWEFPTTPEDGIMFSQLVRKLKTAFKPLEEKRNSKLLLTAAVSTGKWGCGNISDKTAAEFDFLNVMTYDFDLGCKYSAHHSPLFTSPDDPKKNSCATRMEYWSKTRHYPKDKLVFGIPAYFRVFENCKPYEAFDLNDKSKTRYELGWNKIAQLTKEKSWTRKLDPVSQSPCYFSPDGKSFCGGDDPESVKTKAEWAKAQGYRGVFFWAMSHDKMPDGTFPLSLTVFKVFSGQN